MIRVANPLGAITYRSEILDVTADYYQNPPIYGGAFFRAQKLHHDAEDKSS